MFDLLLGLVLTALLLRAAAHLPERAAVRNATRRNTK
jgi:hypothetical protein